MEMVIKLTFSQKAENLAFFSMFWGSWNNSFLCSVGLTYDIPYSQDYHFVLHQRPHPRVSYLLSLESPSPWMWSAPLFSVIGFTVLRSRLRGRSTGVSGHVRGFGL